MSSGCSPNATDPCQCVPDPDYGMLEGELPEVTPESESTEPFSTLSQRP